MERNDLVQLALCTLTVAVTWLALGLEPGQAIMRQDGMNSLLPIVTLLTDTGDWKALAYRPEYFGGTNLLGTYGILPVTIALAKSGISPVTNLNLSLAFIQLLFGFLAGRAIVSLSGKNLSMKADAVLTITTTWLVAFAPMIGWRINVGHLDQISGLLFVQAATALWICTVKGRLSVTTLIAVTLALAHGLCVPGFQMITYALVFGAPLFAAFVIDTRCVPGGKHLAQMLLCGISALLIASPVLAPMVTYALGPDASRAPGAETVTWSFLTSTASDWLSSISWFDHGISGRPAPLLHEINYAVGPALCLSTFLVMQQRWLTLAGLGISVSLCLLFSMNIQPVSTWLSALPLLGDFRVPSRSIMPVMIIWQTIGIALFLAGWPSKKTWQWTVSVVAGIFVMVNLTAFSARISFEKEADRRLAENRRIGALAIEQAPDLASPLTRASFDIGRMGLLMSAAGRLHTINGYGFPSRHFSRSVQQLETEEPIPTRAVFNVLPGTEAFSVLGQRYNIRFNVDMIEGSPSITRLPATRGEVWSDGCSLRFAPVRYEPRAFDVSIANPPDRACRVSVSMTFAANLAVAAVTGAELQPLRTRITDESLLGMTIPAHTQEIRIRALVPFYPWTILLLGLGITALMAMAYLRLRPRPRL